MSHKGKQSEMSRKTKRREPTRREEGLVSTREHMITSQKRSQKIFLKLVEETVSPDTFAEMLKYINPDIYEQIVMDRGASQVCGYPLCPNEHVDTYGDALFKIRNNKVYDIAVRRNFCSDVCYEASEIVKDQVSVEPLYLREDLPEETLKVEVPLLDKLRGRYGKMIDIAGGLNIPYMSHAKSSRSFTSFTEVAEDSLKMCAENKEECKGESSKKQASSNLDSSNKKSKPMPSGSSTQENTKNATDKDETKHSWRQTEGDRNNKKENTDTQMSVFQIEQAFREWMTFESLRLILGDQFVKGMLEDFGANWEDYDSAEGLKLGVEAKAKYIALCRKLEEEEKDERSEPELEIHEVFNRPKQPLPDYQQLQEDAKKQELKVVSFMGGQDQYEDIKADQNIQAKEEEVNASFPRIDSHSQVEWRQSIVLDKFEKYLKPFLPLAQLDESKVTYLIRDLIYTFSFSPNNIIFKPLQWNFVSLLVLKMLSIRIPAIKSGMEVQEFHKFQEALLSTFGLDEGYLDRFLCYITEIQHIIRSSASKDDHNNQEKSKDITCSLQENDALAGHLQKMSVIVEENTDENKMNVDSGESGTVINSLASERAIINVSSAIEDLD